MGLGQRKTRLGFWRRIRGLSQKELGRLMQVTSKTVSNWELDITSPTRAQAEALTKLLRVNLRDLFPFHAF